MNILERFLTLKTNMEAMEKDVREASQATNPNKAAGRRARKEMQKMKNELQGLRLAILQKSKAVA